MARLEIEPDDIRPLVRLVVAEVLQQATAEHAKVDGRLAYSEAEAARLLGLARHQLRDCRLRHEIEHCRIAGKIYYRREHLESFLGRSES